MPSLAVDGEPVPILHVSQLARLLGLPAPARRDGRRLAEDAADVLRAWLDQLRPLSLALLLAPTPSRGRSLRNLTVNVFHPFTLLPGALTGTGFPWHPEDDERLEQRLGTADEIVAYAEGVHAGWSAFLDERSDLERDDLVVESPRGAIGWLDLLDHQRWHAAFHYRQLLAFLDEQGVPGPTALPLALLDGLELPEEVF